MNNSNQVLVKTRPVISALDFSRDDILDFLRDKLADKGVVAAYLIGSCASGEHGPWSDIDVIIIKDTELPFPERAGEFFPLFDLGIPVDIFVYTPQEAAHLDKSPTSFWTATRQQRIKIL